MFHLPPDKSRRRIEKGESKLLYQDQFVRPDAK